MCISCTWLGVAFALASHVSIAMQIQAQMQAEASKA